MLDNMKEIVDDLRAERHALDRFLQPLSDQQWDVLTPAEGWTIKDSIAHLAYYDEVAVRLIGGATIEEAGGAVTHEGRRKDIEKGRGMKPSQIISWWRGVRDVMAGRLSNCDPKHRIPWKPSPMAARTFATARLMETWAHGLDCYDAVGVEPEYTDRLRHIAMLAWMARPFAYQVNGLALPKSSIRLELTLPSGAIWIQGPAQAGHTIRGKAKEFCRVAVRRGHWKDTDLTVQGEDAETFIGIVQTYAGPPGSGRKPRKQA